MPLALSVNQTYWISLNTDLEQPENLRPAFCFRFMSYAESMAAADVLDEYEQAMEQYRQVITARIDNPADADQWKGQVAAAVERSKKAGDAVVETAIKKLAGWRNMICGDQVIEFAPEKLLEICNFTEVLELLHSQMSKQRLDVEDKKKYDLPLPSSTDESAGCSAETVENA